MEVVARECENKIIHEMSLYRPTVLIPESIDPDIDARRVVDRHVKKAAANAPEALRPWLKGLLREFSRDDSNQRAWRIAQFSHLLGPQTSPSNLLSVVQEIEDSMNIDIGRAVRAGSAPYSA
jgi:hypothetical protein